MVKDIKVIYILDAIFCHNDLEIENRSMFQYVSKNIKLQKKPVFKNKIKFKFD